MAAPGSAGGSSGALRALRAADDEVQHLRRYEARAGEARGLVLRVANAVERSLRRLLRDDERAELAVRLAALAPDELSPADILAELRRNDRIPMELGAAIHDLFDIRRRLESGGSPSDEDARRTVEAVERLEPEIRRVPPPAFVAAAPLPEVQNLGDPMPASDAYVDDSAEGAGARRTRRAQGVPTWAIGTAAAFLVAVVVAAWAVSNRGPDQMDQGVTLFRTGAYADAAHHFWRYAEANPEDPTPHLYLARIHRRMDRPELAAGAIREAQRLAPEDPAVHRELGFLLIDTDRSDLAVERFGEALRMDPNSAEGWVGLVRALRASGRDDEIETALADAPAEVRALLTQPVVD